MTDGSASALDQQPPGPHSDEIGDIPARHHVAQRCVPRRTPPSITITLRLLTRAQRASASVSYKQPRSLRALRSPTGPDPRLLPG